MHILSAGYSHTRGVDSPLEWLSRIGFYTGILEELAKDNRVTSIEQIDYDGIMERNGVEYHFLNSRPGVSKGVAKLNRYIRDLSPDVVLINGLSFPLQVINLRSMLPSLTKIILLHRADKPAKGIKRGLQVFADRCVDHYAFVSEEMGNSWVKKGIISSRKKIIEAIDASSVFNYGNREEARNITGVSGNPVFLWVGRLEANKDPVTVVKGFQKYAAENRDARLYMIFQDNGLLNEVRRLVAESEDPDCIRLIGKVERDDLEPWYNSADYFISGSHYEGSGISVVESMSCGCIPILTNIVSFRKLSLNGTCGVLYKAGNADALYNALNRLGEIDKDEMRERILSVFSENFSFRAIAGKLNSVIHHNAHNPTPA